MPGSDLCILRNETACLVISKTDYIVLSPNFHIQISASDLYIPRISLPILPNRQADPGNILIAHRHKNKELGTRPHSLISGNT
jgi:hypothetical protein